MNILTISKKYIPPQMLQFCIFWCIVESYRGILQQKQHFKKFHFYLNIKPIIFQLITIKGWQTKKNIAKVLKLHIYVGWLVVFKEQLICKSIEQIRAG